MANDLEHKKGLLRIKRGKLQELETRAATYAPVEVPSVLLRQIDDLKEEIRELETGVAALEQPSPSIKPNEEKKRPEAEIAEPEKPPLPGDRRGCLYTRTKDLTRIVVAFSALFVLAATLLVGAGSIITRPGRATATAMATINRAPIIGGSEIAVSPAIITPGSTAMLTVAATDPDEDALTYTWTAQKGSVPPGPRADSTITYRAPNIPGDDVVKVTVSDGRGGVAEASVIVRVVMGGAPTDTPTSPAKVATETPTNTPTSTPTSTPMDTPRPLPTATQTSSPPPTATPTQIPTPIPTAIPLPPSPTPTTSTSRTGVRPADEMVMVYVPAGPFLMGASASDTQAENDEKPQHEIYLDAFWIDKYEVTNGQYKKCARAGQCATPPGISSNYYFNFDDHPVNAVRWADAQAYCRWAGARLPTEAQWEKAARGRDRRTYPWGNAPVTGDRANFCDARCAVPDRDTSANDGASHMTTVGSYLAGASPYGALDMAGNVWEWVSDAYLAEYYKTPPEQVGPNPTGPDLPDTFDKVLRGGSWRSLPRDLRAPNRNALPPDYPAGGTDDIGLRCAMSAETP